MATPRSKKYVIELVGWRLSVVNALRRIALSDIPYVAGRNVIADCTQSGTCNAGFTVKCNTGRLHNDTLCERVSLVPLHLSREQVANFIPGSVTVSLDMVNKGNARMDVTSAGMRLSFLSPVCAVLGRVWFTFPYHSDFRTKLHGKPHPNGPACYPACEITRDHPLVTRLYPGEQISLEMTLSKSTASDNAAFAVASTVAVSPRLDNDQV